MGKLTQGGLGGFDPVLAPIDPSASGDPIANAVFKKLPKPVRTIVNPIGVAGRKVLKNQRARAWLDPLNLRRPDEETLGGN